VTHGDFVAREYSVREPIKPPSTCLSDHDNQNSDTVSICNEAYLTTKDSHYRPKSKTEASNTMAAGNANTVITTYNIINGSPDIARKEAVSSTSVHAKALPYEGYFPSQPYGKKTPRSAT